MDWIKSNGVEHLKYLIQENFNVLNKVAEKKKYLQVIFNKVKLVIAISYLQ
jgi:hypothetical protein